MRRFQSCNLPNTQQIQTVNTGGLAAGRSGAVNDGVLLFAANGTFPLTQFGMSSTNDANAGLSISITEPGVYVVELGYTVAATTSVIGGISLNQTAGLTGDPAFANAGTLDVVAATAPAGNTAPVKLTTTVFITRALAGAVGGAIIRFLGSNAAGGAPAGITQASAYYRVQRIAELFA